MESIRGLPDHLIVLILSKLHDHVNLWDICRRLIRLRCLWSEVNDINLAEDQYLKMVEEWNKEREDNLTEVDVWNRGWEDDDDDPTELVGSPISFLKFMEGLMRHRDEAYKTYMKLQHRGVETSCTPTLNVKSFNLSMYSPLEEHDLDYILDYIVSRDVEDIQLMINTGEGSLRLLRRLFTCVSLRTLKIVPIGGQVNFIVPESVCLRNLKQLELRSIRFMGTSDLELMVSCSPNIERLVISGCNICMPWNWKISSPHLHDLVIDELRCNARHKITVASSYVRSLKVSASNHVILQFPNLVFLEMRSTVSSDQISSIQLLLENCPRIKILVVEISETPVNIVGEEGLRGWHTEKPFNSLKYHLEEVEIVDSRENHSELQFISYLLKHKRVLKKLSISAYRHNARVEFREEVQCLCAEGEVSCSFF